MSSYRAFCVICLRIDRKLRRIPAVLSEYHDELSDFLIEDMSREYCSECEHLLRKTFNFHNRCKASANILNKWNKMKGKSKSPIDELHLKLPSRHLSVWTPENSKVISYKDSDNPDQVTIKEELDEENVHQENLFKMEIHYESDTATQVLETHLQNSNEVGNTEYYIENKLPITNDIPSDTVLNASEIIDYTNSTTTNEMPISNHTQVVTNISNTTNNLPILTDDKTIITNDIPIGIANNAIKNEQNICDDEEHSCLKEEQNDDDEMQDDVIFKTDDDCDDYLIPLSPPHKKTKLKMTKTPKKSRSTVLLTEKNIETINVSLKNRENREIPCFQEMGEPNVTNDDIYEKNPAMSKTVVKRGVPSKLTHTIADLDTINNQCSADIVEDFKIELQNPKESMPRPQTARKIGNIPHENIKEGLKLIRNGESIRKASKRANVPFATLKRYYWKTKDSASLEELLPSQLQPNYSVNRVFTAEQETVLENYFTHCALLFYGLTAKESRRVAYQSAKINNLKMPASWDEKEMAGKDWLVSFRRRHNITLKKPEECSLARATAFNKSNVSKFFDNFLNLISRSPNFADGTRIFNLDETSTTTVQKPQRVLAPIGRKTIGKVTSGERGTLVTTCCIVSASGNFLPPVMVFPRKNFIDHMIKNTPPGTLGLATPTGWMNTALFPEVIKHFIKHTNATKENPCILIMDNHESHLSLEALDLAKAAGVHILTLPPHTSAKLQPLDVGIYGPFKTFYNAAIDSWMLRNPGKPMTIYDLSEIIGSAFQKAMTPRNITNSFSKCGIYPFDRHIFSDEDFLPSSVTDRPNPEDLRDVDASTPDSISLLEEFAAAITPEISSAGPSDTRASTENPGQKTSDEIHENQPNDSSPFTPKKQHISESVTDVVKEPEYTVENILINTESPSTSAVKPIFKSPFEFRDPIKAGPRKTNRKRRKPGCSLIPTDTPEKAIIEQERNMIKRRKEKLHAQY